ncbi:MAG TPA: amidohydrolase [Pseudonocardiaceae bacterium]|jgi:hippurate hydrolase|nr:amidohydrolase [Pseudonocardiaceae bacterium]
MSVEGVLGRLAEIKPGLHDLYRDLHAHPELSNHERRTAEVIATRLKDIGVEVNTGVGGHGVVGVVRNGEGPTVLLRADFDALPVTERTGLPYASTESGIDEDGNAVGVMHACGHDMHVTCLLGALDLLAGDRSGWAGTVVAAFQPAEEMGTGALAMIEAGFFDRFPRPDVVLGQHVGPMPAGMLGAHPGPAFAALDSLVVRVFGRGGHGSRPETTVDPIVIAAAIIMRLQTVVAREVAPSDVAVVTVGSVHAGTRDNIIPDEAVLEISIRSYTEPVRARVVAAVRRIIAAEAAASGATREPEITVMPGMPLLRNDYATTTRATTAFHNWFGTDRLLDPGAVTGSEDFGIFGDTIGVPYCYWILGGTEPATYLAAVEADRVDEDIPSNHSPFFAPVIEPTVSTGISALVVAALDWLGGPE